MSLFSQSSAGSSLPLHHHHHQQQQQQQAADISKKRSGWVSRYLNE